MLSHNINQARASPELSLGHCIYRERIFRIDRRKRAASLKVR